MPADDVTRDVFWKMYQEHCVQGRHHETQRSTVAASFVAISTVIIGVVTLDKGLTVWDLPMTTLLFTLGAFGAVFSAKHYERYSLHVERARAYRNALDALLPDQPLKKLKRDADAASKEKFPRLFKLRLNWFWIGLYLFLSVMGLMLSAIAAFHPIPPPD